MDNISFVEYLSNKYPRTSSFLSGLSLFFVDVIILIGSICFGFFVVNLIVPSYINFRSFINYSIYIPFILLIFCFIGLYPGIMIPPTEELKKFCLSTFFGFTAIILSILISNKNGMIVSRMIVKDSEDICVIIAFAISFPVATILLPAFRELSKHLFAKMKFWGVPAVVYCTGNSGDYIIKKLQHNKYLGYHPAVIIDSAADTPCYKFDIPVFPPTDEIHKLIKKHNIKTAVICDYAGEQSYLMSAYRYTISVSRLQTNFTYTQQLKDIAGILAFASIHNLTFKGNLFLKRFMDIFIILLFSPILIPVMLLLAILTKITSKGPVFYGHKRVGKNGKEFKCWKFRSMCIDADKKLEKILAENPEMRIEWEKERKFVNDPRITKFGSILRKTSLDELPQIFNILAGQMSFVGPRPVTEPELVKYGKYKDFVLSVAPGLSGMWQISGRSDTGYEERVSFDTYYIQNWSIWLDIWILIKTVWTVLSKKGAY